MPTDKPHAQQAAYDLSLGPFPDWDNPDWDQSVRLLDATKLWCPALGRRLQEAIDKAKGLSSDGAVVGTDADDGAAAEVNGEISDTLRDDLTRLLREWAGLDETDRLVAAKESASRLIIEKTKHRRPHLLACKLPAPDGSLYIEYVRVPDASHEALAPCDFDITNSMIKIKASGAKWLPARVLGGIHADAERKREIRVAREALDAAVQAAWATQRDKPIWQWQFFSFDEIAKALARVPGRLEIDPGERDRVLIDLVDWTKRGEFDLSGDLDVVIFTAEPPYFVPLASLCPTDNGETLLLRREACRRYLQNSALEGAPRLLREWFGETANVSEEGAPLVPALHNEGMTAADAPPPQQAQMLSAENLKPASDVLVSLEEWIFARHGRRLTWKKLYDEAGAEAREGKLGGFTRSSFTAAFQRVYDTKGDGLTKKGRPPASGRPLQTEYQCWWAATQKVSE